MAVRARVHGGAGTGKDKRWPEYSVWNSMLQRCNNPNNPAYKDYGGRGIAACERWSAFKFFIEDMGRKPAAEYSLDRIDNNLGYSKENCRWATRDLQNKNRSFISRAEATALRQENAALRAKLGIYESK